MMAPIPYVRASEGPDLTESYLGRRRHVLGNPVRTPIPDSNVDLGQAHLYCYTLYLAAYNTDESYSWGSKTWTPLL